MSTTASVKLIDNAAATGAGQWPGGKGVLTVRGTFGGTSATLEYNPGGSVWLAVKAMSDAGVQTSVALTADGMIGFMLPPGPIRCTLTGGTPSAIYAVAARIPE